MYSSVWSFIMERKYGIIYHSEKGKGTTATVVIPKKQEDVHEKI